MGIEPTSEAWDKCLSDRSRCRHACQAVPKRQNQVGVFGALQPPATIRARSTFLVGRSRRTPIQLRSEPFLTFLTIGLESSR
jgi:hypothetical protein